MKFTRLVTGLTAAGLLGLTPVALAAAPANAGVVFNTVTTLEVPDDIVDYKDALFLNGSVSAVDPATGAPSSVSDGTVSLQIATPKNPSWKEIATDDAGSYVSFPDVKAVGNAAYRLVYSGATTASTDPDTYNPSESAPGEVKVRRLVSMDKTKRNLVLKVSVKPQFKKKKVVVRIKKGKKFVAYKKFTTDRKGVAFIKLPAPRRGNVLDFLVIVPGDKHFVGYAEQWQTITV